MRKELSKCKSVSLPWFLNPGSQRIPVVVKLSVKFKGFEQIINITGFDDSETSKLDESRAENTFYLRISATEFIGKIMSVLILGNAKTHKEKLEMSTVVF